MGTSEWGGKPVRAADGVVSHSGQSSDTPSYLMLRKLE